MIYKIFAILAITIAMGLSACATDFGETCEFPEGNEIENACYPAGQDQAFCVYNQSETCASRQCGSYVGSEAFCTETCETTEDCPPNAFCQTLSGSSITGFCVPNAYDDSASPQ